MTDIEPKAIQWTGDNREAIERFLGSPGRMFAVPGHGIEKVMEHPTTGAKTLYVWSPLGLKAVPEGDFLLLTDDGPEVWKEDHLNELHALGVSIETDVKDSK